jgi:hypothetical protein
MQNTGSVEVLMGECPKKKHPVDGHIMNLRKDVKKPETMLDYLTFKGSSPSACRRRTYVPRELSRRPRSTRGRTASSLTPLKSQPKVPVEEFRIDRAMAAATAFRITTSGRSPARGSRRNANCRPAR